MQSSANGDVGGIFERTSTHGFKMAGKWSKSKYQTHFKGEWLNVNELEDWLRADKDDPLVGYCKAYKYSVRAHLGDMRRHAESKKNKAEIQKLKTPENTPALGKMCE